jgi:hypothetical protein
MGAVIVLAVFGVYVLVAGEGLFGVVITLGFFVVCALGNELGTDGRREESRINRLGYLVLYCP